VDAAGPLRALRRTILSSLRTHGPVEDTGAQVLRALDALGIEARFVSDGEPSAAGDAVFPFRPEHALRCRRATPFSSTERNELEDLVETLAVVDGCGVGVASTLLDRLGLGVAEVDAQGRFLASNGALREMLGYGADELAGLDYQSITHADHAENDAVLHRALVEGLPRATLEKGLRRKDGREVWVAVTIERQTHAVGDPSFVVTVRDITARHRAEVDRDDVESRQQLLIEHAPVGIAVFDRSMRYLLVSQRYLEEYGLERSAVVGRSHYEVFTDIPERWRVIHRRCLEGAVERCDADAFPRADGGTDWVRWEIRPWRDHDGTIGGIVLYSEVITHARQIAAALDESEQRYQSLFEQAGVGIAHVDRTANQILRANEVFCQIVGRGRDDLLGRTWMELTHPEDLPMSLGHMRRLESTGVPSVTHEKRFVRPDGVIVWGRVTVSVVSVGKVVILEDVTERKAAEQALQESERRLATIFRASLAGLLIGRVSDGRIVDASASFTQLFGWARDEVVGATPGELGLFGDDDFMPVSGTTSTHAHPARCRLRNGEQGHFLVTRGRIEIGGESCWVCLFHDVTAWRHADEALRASEVHLRTIFDLAPVGIVETDLPTGRIRWVNGHFARLVGQSAEDLYALSSARRLLHPDDQLLPVLSAAQRLHGPTVDEPHELRLVRADGSVAWIRARTRPLAESAGEPTHAISIVEDVTERRERESLLRVHTSAFRAAANGIAITSRDGTIESVNPACAELTGYDESEIVGRKMSIFSSGRQAPDFYAAMWRTILDGGVWRGELVNRRKDGSLYHEEMTITPLRDAEGRERFIAIKQDVSARRQAEDELRASEDRYRSLVDDLEDMVLSTEAGGRITFANRALATLGRQPLELLGRPFLELVFPEDIGLVDDLVRDLVPREVRLCDAAGKPRVARVLARPQLVDKEQVGVTFVAVDLSARRETEEQLRAAQKMEAVGRLAGGVAHDFNNLLSVILSYTDLAVSDLRPEDPLRADLQEVLEAAQRAEGLTRQLLAFSRKQVLNVESVELNALVAGLARMLGRLIGEDIELDIRAGAGLHPLRADRGQLEQVLMNLVVNARDALPQGGHVRIETRNVRLEGSEAKAHELAPGDYALLSVTDDGCGMDEPVRQRIFEPFFTTKGVGKGTGLGLSMVYGIVRQSGGAIEVRSAPGAGTTFDIFLPADRGTHKVVVAPALSQRPRTGHETILVVEDEAALRALLRRILVASGYDVHVAANAGEALLICEQLGDRIQLVLTDVVMPGMSGTELVRRFETQCPSARVIFMSGYTDDDLERHRVLDAPILRKPFDWRTLARRVREALDVGTVATSPPPRIVGP